MFIPYSINDNDEKDEPKRKISMGICSRFYLYILFSGIFKLFSLILIGDYKVYDDGIGLLGFCPKLKKFNFMQSIDIYLGYLIFGLIFNHYRSEGKNKKGIAKFNFIVNKPKKIIKNLKIKIMLVCLSFIAHIEVKKVLYIQGFQFFNFWTLEIVFILYLMRKYFTMDSFIFTFFYIG